MLDTGRPARSRVGWYHPGEIVLVTRVPREQAADEPQVRADIHSAARDLPRVELEHDHSTVRSFTFDAPGESKTLVFSFHKLTDSASPRAVKDAVESLQQQLGDL